VKWNVIASCRWAETLVLYNDDYLGFDFMVWARSPAGQDYYSCQDIWANIVFFWVLSNDRYFLFGVWTFLVFLSHEISKKRIKRKTLTSSAHCSAESPSRKKDNKEKNTSVHEAQAGLLSFPIILQ